ncbi:hypothetical protein JK386_05825 [Nocardioides sp. zg-536]|uniref:Cardiolipin synthase N-terminal domain-containing protein n=1 Tax=Nocardioides faecalis TaxID=2803858 RepID=A0A938Y727_9ACTN|nr:hypothetical protein [Nocardioides faecalis]MBM9459413.1 hypothetical protein [Nocardioides faecalis]QVI59479.1 hypothetical protein KG111_03690 [Nocardioides faecalis]
MIPEPLLLLVVSCAPSLLAVVDMFRFRSTTWERAGQNRPLWIALALLMSCLGPALYVTGPRLVLRRTVREMRAEARVRPVQA